MRTRTLELSVLAVFCWSCGDTPATVPICPATSALKVHLTTTVPATAISSDLRVSGTVSAGDGDAAPNIAIRSVLVAGIPATSDGFNFKSWSAVVPLAAIASIADPMTHKAKLDVIVIDACSNSTQLENAPEVTVPPIPGIDVTSLILRVQYPSTFSFIPDDGVVSARIEVEGSPMAAGAVVNLTTSASEGKLAGQGTTAAVMLMNIDGHAIGRVDYVSETPGANVIEARLSNGSVSTVGIVKVVDNPRLIPGERTIDAGSELGVLAATDGLLKSCQATPSAAFGVTSGDMDLMASAEVGNLATAEIVVEALEGATSGSRVTVSCSDVFGQLGSAVYTIR